jgi:hypothetical protein
MSLLKTAEGQLVNSNIPAYKALADVAITERFIKLAQQIRRIAPRSDEFLYFSTIMLHAAEHALVDPKTGEVKKDKNGKEIIGGFDENWKWHCSEPIDPYANANGDVFPEIELKKAYKKWIGKSLCKNHESSDVEGIRGIIIDAYYDDKYKRVIGLCALDQKTYPDLAHKVKSGYCNSTSMGTAVGRAICTVCQQSAVTERDYCDCMRSKKGQRINGVKVGEINIDLNPIELSLVVTPADPQAKVLKIIASLNNYTDQRNSLLEEKDRVEASKLAKLDSSITSIESQLNRLFAECTYNSCQFVRDKTGYIKMVKSAQLTQTWGDYFSLAKQVDAAKKDSSQRANLLNEMSKLRGSLDVKDLNTDSNLKAYLDAMSLNDPELHQKELNPLLNALNAATTQPQSMQEHQFTSPDGPDKDLGLDSGSEVTMPANEQETGGRVSKVVNPSESDVKPNKGGDLGPELGSPSDQFQFGNYASNEQLMAKGGKKTADIDENLTLLLQQTQEIEKEVNTMKETLNNTNVAVDQEKTASEELKMNEARLKLRSAQRQALINKQANGDEKCEVCDKVECECEEKKEKKAYWQGTTEPTPGKPQYKPDNGGEPKNRMNDKQMHQDKAMGGNDGSFPGDEKLKKEHLRAELEERALKRRAYWQGTTEPTPGKPQYKADPLENKLRLSGDKQMHQDKSMGGNDGSFPGDEKLKKEYLRAELVPGVLRTKFSALKNDDGSYNKKASYFTIFAGNNKLLTATAEEIYGDELDKEASDGKTGWELLQTPEYGRQVMAAIRKDGFEKIAYLLKGAQALPEMPPALDANQAPLSPMAEPKAGEQAQKVEVDANELMSLVGNMEDALDRIRTEVTGESEGEVKDTSVETKDDAQMAEVAGDELTASVITLGREVYADLDKSADELALLVDHFEKAASLNPDTKKELQKLAIDAIADGKALLDEAESILAVAGKVPAGLKAYQEKQKGKKKDDGKNKKEDKKDKGKKDEKKEDKKDKDKDKKKKTKKAEMAEALMKLAEDLQKDEDTAQESNVVVAEKEDELEKEMKELGLADDDKCGMCGMAMDKEHTCTASAKDALVREALATRRMKREAILKAAEDKKYNVMPDDHGMIGDAHKGGGTTTQLDNKPAGDGAKVETIDEVHKHVLDVAESVPTGKQGAAELSVKEAEIKAVLVDELKVKKAEEDKNRFRVKLRRAYDLGLMMQEKSMIPRTKEALDMQVDDIMKFDDQAFESYKRVVANTQAAVKTASVKDVPQVGIRNDNSQSGDNVDVSLTDQLIKMW